MFRPGVLGRRTRQGVRAFIDGEAVGLGRPSFCGADRLANVILLRDPKCRPLPSGEASYVFTVR